MHENFPLIKSKERGTNTQVALSRLDNRVVPMFSSSPPPCHFRRAPAQTCYSAQHVGPLGGCTALLGLIAVVLSVWMSPIPS